MKNVGGLIFLLVFLGLNLFINLDGIVCSIQVDILRRVGLIQMGFSGLVNLPGIYAKILVNHIQIIATLSEFGYEYSMDTLRSMSLVFGDTIEFSTSSMDCLISEYAEGFYIHSFSRFLF